MRRSVTLFAIAILAGCDSAPQPAGKPVRVQSVGNSPTRPAQLVQPPMLQDEAPTPKPKVMPWETPKEIVLSPEDEKVRSSLPFTPAIAMDPIDGGKISIRAATPTYEYKGRIFYFNNEENRRTFIASPDQYLKSPMMRL